MKEYTKNLVVAFFLFVAYGVPCMQSVAYAAPISTIEVRGLYSIPEEELLYLLNIEKGAVLDRSELSAGVKRAFLKGIFEDIIIDSPGPADNALTITVKEKPLIDSISIKGNRHFSNRFIRKKLGFSAGDRLTLLLIRKGVASLEEGMREKGFINAGVSYMVTPAVKNKVSLEITVQEGQPEIVKQIIIPSQEDTVKKYLRLSVNDIFDRTEMEHLRDALLQHYKKRHFVGVSFSYRYQDGTLTLDLNPGRMLTVTFRGNAAIKTNDLIKEAPFFEINEISDDLVEETIARITSLYHTRGFLMAEAVPVLSTAPDALQLEIFISEGERYKVKAITFEGATVPEKKLMDILVSRAGDYYNPDDLESDTNNLIDFYRALGYLYIEVQEPGVSLSDHNVTIAFYLNEGPQVKVTTVEVTGTKFISEAEILKNIPIKTGSPYNEVDISDSRRRILALYGKQGFLDARVEVEKEIADTSAQVTFVVDEGAMTLFGKNIIIGNEKTKQQVIKREIAHKTNNPLDSGMLLQEKQRLYRLGIFSDVEVVPSEQYDSRRDILYRVREANAGAVEVGLGYGEYEKYRGFLDISYRNLFGMNKQASFRTEISSLEKRLILSYSEPYFLNRDLTFKSLLLFEKRKEKNIDTGEISYRLTRETASAGVSKKLSNTVKGELYYDFSVVKTTDVKPGIVLSREDTGTLIISGVRPELIYDSRDNPFEPKKGILAGLSFKAASSVLFSQTDFLKLLLYANTYRYVNRRMVFAVSLRGGGAQGYGATRELPIVERFFLGGRTTVRGYDQDTLGPKSADHTPIGGNAFVMGNFELRTNIGRGFGIVNFVDTGNVWSKVQEIDLSRLRYTTGLGLRYSTPVGPFRVDYGYKLNREKGESVGAIHFSLGHSF